MPVPGLLGADSVDGRPSSRSLDQGWAHHSGAAAASLQASPSIGPRGRVDDRVRRGDGRGKSVAARRHTVRTWAEPTLDRPDYTKEPVAETGCVGARPGGR